MDDYDEKYCWHSVYVLPMQLHALLQWIIICSGGASQCVMSFNEVTLFSKFLQEDQVWLVPLNLRVSLQFTSKIL